MVCLAGGVVVAAVALNLLAYRHAYAMTHLSAGDSRTHEPEKLTVGQRLRVRLCGVDIPCRLKIF